ERNYLLPEFSANLGAALRKIVAVERVDLVIPTSDAGVAMLSALRAKLKHHTFLPRRSVIERCQDKYILTQFLLEHGIPAPITYPIGKGAKVEALFRRFKRSDRLWCRIRAGAGSYGAIPVKTPAQVKSWIAYWQAMRGVAPGSFTLSE